MCSYRCSLKIYKRVSKPAGMLLFNLARFVSENRLVRLACKPRASRDFQSPNDSNARFMYYNYGNFFSHTHEMTERLSPYEANC